MAYNPEAVARRRCTAKRKDGKPCRAWALWDDPRQLCMAHAGRHHTGPMPPRWERRADNRRSRHVICSCNAYAWPHRPGGGLCRWPLPPEQRSTIPPSTHSFLSDVVELGSDDVRAVERDLVHGAGPAEELCGR
jgi:hypothetical protein